VAGVGQHGWVTGSEDRRNSRSLPVYHGFPVLDSSEVDGFRFGMITDFITDPNTTGDAFVVAPDGARAGLVWESEAQEPYFHEVLRPDSQRWGVWGVGLPLPLRNEEDARQYLWALLPELRPRWERWTGGRPRWRRLGRRR
jgi:hypothetical protein